MADELTEFNPFEMMETQTEINEFLMECYQDDDPNTFATTLGQLMKINDETANKQNDKEALAQKWLTDNQEAIEAYKAKQQEKGQTFSQMVGQIKN